MTRISVLIAQAVVGAQQVLAQDKLVEEFVRRMSKAVLELPNHDSPENDLIAGGLSAQDAARSVEGLVDGVVRCLVKDLRVYSEEHNEPFSDKLPHMLESLDKSGPAPLLRSMMIVSGARGESCALDELQKAGISLDSLDWKAICCDVASA